MACDPCPEAEVNEPADLQALAALGADHRPRTRHLGGDGRPKYTNALIHEASPYLLQHAHNPVDWRPWGAAAFAEAARRGVPVFLSVGYSTCHWCHVMEHESFEDEEIAGFLNDHYVPVKVDREERPDVDAVYMEFLQLTTGGGGWPMSVFLTAEKRPLFAGTYFPARDGDRGPHRGFLTLLRLLDENWRDPQFQGQADEAIRALGREAAASEEAAGVEALLAGGEIFKRLFDAEWGGFGRAPKFPRPAVLDFLLRQWRRSGEPELLTAVETTLWRMHCGGMYDHVGGGFARYSVDRQWLVPHFEKMLYDNAQLVIAYVEAWQATGKDLYRHVAEDVLAYLDREMSDPRGGFYSATDADSADESGHMHEGLFFVWTPAEVEALLDPADAAWVCERFDIRRGGNFEGRSIAHLEAPLSPAERGRWLALRETLYAARAKRIPPGLDDKVLVAWNGLAISAFARAAVAFARPELAARAARAARFVLDEMADGNRLHRAWRAGKARHPAVLEDYAALIGGLLDLLEATGEVAWLSQAELLQAVLDTHFSDPAGGYFRTADDGEVLLFREKPAYDGAEPSGNSLAALNLLRLAAITDDEGHRRRAEGVLRALGEMASRAPHAVPKLLCAIDRAASPAVVAAVVTAGDEGAEALWDEARRVFAPHVIRLVSAEDGALARQLAVFAERPAKGGATAYVCTGTSCRPPTGDAAALAAMLRGRG
ncbi:MAG: thioredoxin domain-containing protein [Myxococcales bacterium]|nr:thioredoxin domain-containing protein [Myxococcales bacterium]